MTEEDAPKRRGRKPAAVTTSEETKVETTKVEQPKVEEAKVEETPTKKVEAPQEKTFLGGRVLERGSDIEVNTDEDGFAQETVYQEIPLLGTERVAHVLIAREGTLYKK